MKLVQLHIFFITNNRRGNDIVCAPVQLLEGTCSLVPP